MAPQARARLLVRLLGPPHVLRDGELVGFDTRKAIALLAHLALSERARPRDALADLLWPEADLERARGALRRTLSVLRSGLGAEHLEATRDHVRLLPGPGLAVDVWDFQGLRGSGDLAGAVATYGGDLLEGFVLRDAPGFEEWLAVESEALRRDLVTTVGGLAAQQEADGDVAGAVRSVRRWLDLDPLHEPAHQALIRLLATAGDRAGALEQYRACVRVLSRELGVPPLSATSRLYEAVNRGSFEPRPVPVAPAPAPAVPTPPPAVALVGRSEALGRLREAHARAAEVAQVVVVEGEAGIGKTRLVEEFLAGVAAPTLVTRAHEDEEGLAYGPVVDTVRARMRQPGSWLAELPAPTVAELARLVPEVADGRADLPPTAAGPAAESRFLAAVWQALVAALLADGAGGEHAGVWLVDDVQWADEATLGLLAYGLRRLEGLHVLVVVVRRTPLGDARLRPLLAAARVAGAAIVELQRLGESDVRELVGRERPGGDAEEARRLWETTEGVPLLLVEYLRSAPVPGDGDAVPAGARAMLSARLEPLSETGRQVVTAAAVLGRSFAVDTVREVGGRTDEETVAAVEELVGHGVLREREDGYAFAHELVRGVVLEETSLARRRLLHGRAAAVAGTPAAVVARHLALAGDELAASHARLRAAGEASALFAHAEAADHLRAALALGHPDPATVLLALGEVQTLLGEYGDALASLRAAGATPSASAVAVEHRLGRLQHRRGDYAAAVTHLVTALAGLAEGEVPQRATVTTDLSLATYAMGEGERAQSLALDAQRLAERAGDLRAQCQALNLLGLLATAADDPRGALEPLRRGLALAERLADPELRVAALNNLALALAAAGEPEQAIAPATTALELCTAFGDRHREAALHNNLADLLHATGRAEEAMAHLKAAVGIFAAVGRDAEPRPEIWKLVRW